MNKIINYIKRATKTVSGFREEENSFLCISISFRVELAFGGRFEEPDLWQKAACFIIIDSFMKQGSSAKVCYCVNGLVLLHLTPNLELWPQWSNYQIMILVLRNVRKGFLIDDPIHSS